MSEIQIPSGKISNHFTWHDALWLKKWDREGCLEDGLNQQILDTLIFFFNQKMDVVRDYFNLPIRVHVTWRPAAYNILVKGSLTSAHMAINPNVSACDFDVIGLSCDDARLRIIQDNKLEVWKMRMEDNGIGSNWIHLDTKSLLPGGSRFFKP